MAFGQREVTVGIGTRGGTRGRQRAVALVTRERIGDAVMVCRTQRRRGVVILVVLSLLVLFVLLAVTYAIVAGQYDRAARSHARQELFGEDPARLADRMMYDLVRGTNRVTSPLRGHDLLQDKYGQSFRAEIYNEAGDPDEQPEELAEGQFIEFAVLLPPEQPSDIPSGYFNGRVLTFLDGPCGGLSTRVVAHRIDESDEGIRVDRFRVLALQPDQNQVVLPQRGNTILMNGAPFAGTGPGFNPNYDPETDTPSVQNATGLTEHALLPNRVGESSEDVFENYLRGGMNEGYDAADYQNMALAAVTEQGVIPSFHRPALIHHWMQDDVTESSNFTTSDGTRQAAWGILQNPDELPSDWTPTSTALLQMRRLRRRVIFRPMPWDHPNFTGSNPEFDGQLRTAAQIEQALLSGPWDVDNNNDGRPDSIWIDPGFAPQTAPDGRLYKPLVAILCQDLDGRLNVNAHGNLDHFPSPLVQDVPLAGGQTTQDLPRGQGFGPAEINLNSLIQDDDEYGELLRSRYGPNRVPGRTGFDLLSATRFYEYPDNFFDGSLTSFFSFFDLRGVQSFGADHRGQPLSAFVYDSGEDEFPDLLADNPYEFRLVHPGGHDQPFTLGELERVLRFHDMDAVGLPSRLTDLLSVLRADPSARNAITTHSFDPPVPGVLATDDFHAVGLNRPTSILEMLANRLSRGGVPQERLDDEIAYLLSPDLAGGLRMDINRPLGSGRDSNNNGIVDEHWGPTDNPELSESLLLEAVDLLDRPTNPALADPPLMFIDHDNDGVIGEGDDADPYAFLARYHLARHLYILAMLLKDEGFLYLGDALPPPENGGENGEDNGEDPLPVRDPEETARILAQWAINVVTFRDADSIMYPFEYDPYPFEFVEATGQAWNVDGILETNENEAGIGGVSRGVVWGAERPELLLTETLALHDYRTEDLDEDNEDFFQQRLSPRGSLFVEIYNPWTGHANPPAEFYSDGNDWFDGVLLNKLNGFDHPVWRLAITRLHDQLDEPEGVEIERTVFFASPTEVAGMQDMGAQVHYANADVAPLLPGRYAVVGPGGTTTIGRRMDGDYENGPTYVEATRQIVLAADPDYEVHQVQVNNNRVPPDIGSDPNAPIPDQPTLPADPQAIQPAIAIPVDWALYGGDAFPLALSISEPLGGYPRDEDAAAPHRWVPTAQQGDGAYEPYFDTPLDLDNPFTYDDFDNDDESGDYRIGTRSNHRRIHLQRLANPLAPYHPVTNPYRTIDSMPVDLHRYNGVVLEPGDDPSVVETAVELVSFQRGDFPEEQEQSPNVRNLWSSPQGTVDRESDDEEEPAVHFLDQVLDHTLGYLNRPFQPAYTSANAPPTDLFAMTSYVGAPNTDEGRPPFPWLVWNNRPYLSPYELMQVPASSSARLLHDFTFARDVTDVNPYQPEPDFESGTFGHLKNFFFSDRRMGFAPNLYRLFEFVQTRSPFVDAEIFLNPVVFENPDYPGTEWFRPPFNRISRYRDPGRINLNTIYHPRVWDAIWGEHQRLDFEDFLDDRRGYAATGPNGLPDEATPYPSRFTKAYRPPGSGAMVPPMGPTGEDLKRPDIDSTLLRDIVTGPPSSAQEGLPLLTNQFDLPDDPARDTERHSYFAYQALQRLPNLVTTRSNVYAVWLTIGYFEVEPTAPSEFHPDGYRLGQELGADTGEVRRHRAFYIIDRTIPVAFEPGENHNVDRAVLLRRFIE